MSTRKEVATARMICITIVVGYLLAYCYGYFAHVRPSQEDKVVCGTVTELQLDEDQVGGKIKRIAVHPMARIDFGQYGGYIMNIPDNVAFEGVGTSHCIELGRLDEKYKPPVGWKIFVEFNTVMACGFFAFGFLALLFCIATKAFESMPEEQ